MLIFFHNKFTLKKYLKTILNSLLFTLWGVCFPESDFQKITFQTLLCLFAIRKVGQQKTLSGQKKI